LIFSSAQFRAPPARVPSPTSRNLHKSRTPSASAVMSKYPSRIRADLTLALSAEACSGTMSEMPFVVVGAYLVRGSSIGRDHEKSPSDAKRSCEESRTQIPVSRPCTVPPVHKPTTSESQQHKYYMHDSGVIRHLTCNDLCCAFSCRLASLSYLCFVLFKPKPGGGGESDVHVCDALLSTDHDTSSVDHDA